MAAAPGDRRHGPRPRPDRTRPPRRPAAGGAAAGDASGGARLGVDICPRLVRGDHGSHLANSVARRRVVPPSRDGGQARYIEQPVPERGAVGTAAPGAWALERLDAPLTPADRSGHARMSRRTFARRCHDEVDISPGRRLIRQRVARARHLLESSNLTVNQIAGVPAVGGRSLPAPASERGDRGLRRRPAAARSRPPAGGRCTRATWQAANSTGSKAICRPVAFSRSVTEPSPPAGGRG